MNTGIETSTSEKQKNVALAEDKQQQAKNPFISSGDGGQNYRIFEELGRLPEPSQRKVMVEELLSNEEIFGYFAAMHSSAFKYYLDLLQGKFKGVNIGEYEKHRVIISLHDFIANRTEEIFTLLISRLDESFEQIGVRSVMHQGSKKMPEIAAEAFYIVSFIKSRPPIEYDFLKIDESASLRRNIYLWYLAMFFLSPSNKMFTLAKLKRILSEWSGCKAP